MGDKAAYAAQPERIAAIGAAITAAKPDVWKSKSETDAVVIYLLAAGSRAISSACWKAARCRRAKFR